LSWFQTAFRSEYLRVYRHRDDESAAREARFFLERAGVSAGDMVLDLACGAGRHSRPLAGAGCRVTALDLSPDLLREAARLGTSGLARADMRALPLPGGAYAAVASFFTSFGYFPEVSQDRQVLAEVARVLRPGGRYLMDFLNRAPAVAGLVPRSEDVVDGLEMTQERWVDESRDRVEKRVTIREPGETEPLVSYVESVRLYAAPEIAAMMESVGLEVVDRYGSFRGEPHDPVSSPRLLTLARRT